MSRPRSDVTIRPWRPGDEADLCAIASNRRIWRNLTNRFPYPYAHQDAIDWVSSANADPQRARHFAVISGGALAGGVGFERLEDLGTRTAEIGYWIGEEFWGQGIATAALRTATTLAFAEGDFVRLQATVLDWNPASGRVLEKAGYALEARLRAGAFKDGAICDQLIYAKLRSEHREGP